MSLFAGPVDILVTGISLCAATTAAVAPVMYLRSPVLTDEGVSRVGIELPRRAYDRIRPRRGRPENGHQSV